MAVKTCQALPTSFVSISTHSEGNGHRQKDVRLYSWSNIQVDTVLGEGSFCYVFKVSLIQNNNGEPVGSSMYSSCSGNFEKRRFYALKTLKSKPPRIRQRRRGKLVLDAMTMAAMDLATEAEILSLLEPHDNIVTLHGISSLGLAEAPNDNGMGFFILEDILTETLRDRLNHWRRKLLHQHQEEIDNGPQLRSCVALSPSSSTSSLTTADVLVHNALKRTKSLNERVDTKDKMMDRVQLIGLQVARGVSHLHQHDIIMRDLKPENIGFYYDPTNGQERVKIFDFGMARQLKCSPICREENGLLSINSPSTRRRRRRRPHQPQFVGEIAGSFRYMPPEIMTGKGAWLQSDAYSYGIILWEVCSLSLPYDSFLKQLHNLGHDPLPCCTSSQEALQKLVVRQRYRPSLVDDGCISGSPGLQSLLSQCWTHDVHLRPSFARIIKRLIELALEERCPSTSAVTSVASGPHSKRSKQEAIATPRTWTSATSLVRQYHTLLLAKVHFYRARRENSSWHQESKNGASKFDSGGGSYCDSCQEGEDYQLQGNTEDPDVVSTETNSTASSLDSTLL